MSLTIHQLSRPILVADDDPVIRHLVAAIVKKEGYAVVLASVRQVLLAEQRRS